MKNKIIRAAAILLLVTVVGITFVACGKAAKEQLPQPTDKFFVNDFAGVLNETDANTIYSNGVALQNATTAQAVVVTVESLGGKSAEEYALELGREWSVGDKDKDNGIVVLLSKSDREIYIAVGYGLEGALPDSKTGRIIDTYGIPYFSNDKFSAGLVSVYNAVVNEIYIEYGMQPMGNYVSVSETEDDASIGTVVISWVILIVLVALYIVVFGRRGGLFIFGAPGFGSSSGRFGGGSSGGFGGFSGGGGSFGGGGAGRKF